jgi:hypothetical protein
VERLLLSSTVPIRFQKGARLGKVEPLIHNLLRAVGANVLDFAARGKRGREVVARGTVLEIELVRLVLGVPSGLSLPTSMPPLGRNLSFSTCSIA